MPVIALTSAAANLTTIAAGPIVFSERLPASRPELVVRLGAFALVIVAAALTPPPLVQRGSNAEPVDTVGVVTRVSLHHLADNA